MHAQHGIQHADRAPEHTNPFVTKRAQPKTQQGVPVWRGPGTLRVGVYVQGWVCHGSPVASLCARISVPGPAWLHWWSWLLAGVGASLWIARYCKSWLLFLCKQDRRVESLCAVIPKAIARTGAAVTRSQREVVAFLLKYQSSRHRYRAGRGGSSICPSPETAKEKSTGEILLVPRSSGIAFYKLFRNITQRKRP